MKEGGDPIGDANSPLDYPSVDVSKAEYNKDVARPPGPPASPLTSAPRTLHSPRQVVIDKGPRYRQCNKKERTGHPVGDHLILSDKGGNGLAFPSCLQSGKGTAQGIFCTGNIDLIVTR